MICEQKIKGIFKSSMKATIDDSYNSLFDSEGNHGKVIMGLFLGAQIMYCKYMLKFNTGTNYGQTLKKNYLKILSS